MEATPYGADTVGRITMEPAILVKLEACRTLPTLPAVATEVVRLSRSDDTNAGELSLVVSRDPAIATKLLSTASSPIFLTRAGMPTTVQQAVMRLGANTVMTLALSFSLARLRGTQVTFDYSRFWKRALLSGTAARAVAVFTNCNPDEAFLAGMFQDIGILALHEALGAPYSDLLASVGTDHLRLERMERESLGVDHREVGAWLAARWKLPPYLEHSTRGSHNPESVSGPGAFPAHTRAVALSSYIAEIWLGSIDRQEATRQSAECARLWLNMSGETFTKVLVDVSRALPELSRLFEIPVDEQAMASVVDEARDALVRVSLKNAQTAIQAEHHVHKLAKQKEEAESQARRDALTGLFNRGHFDAQLRVSFDSAVELGRPLSIIFVDVDHFKSVNDKHGHQAGDSVLQSVGKVILRCVRQLDIPVRYGGEEFAIILPATDRAGSKIAAERLRKALEKQEMMVGGGRAISVTASFGVATMDEKFQPNSASDLVKAADDCVYAAKHAGRNRVVSHGE
ncbi:MAG: diguanylate cyclase [Myxococcaceae bacterium]|nr:diguanylate cyclase [Myxococcaceae bacterium]